MINTIWYLHRTLNRCLARYRCASKHPTPHISTASVNGSPSETSGALRRKDMSHRGKIEETFQGRENNVAKQMLCRMNSLVPTWLDVHPQLDLGHHHGAAKVNQLNPERLILHVHVHNVVGFYVRVQDPKTLQGIQGLKELQGHKEYTTFRIIFPCAVVRFRFRGSL